MDNEEKKLLATVNGMPIYSDSVYVVTGKSDDSAPTGFQERGISKTPFPGNKTIANCSWDKYMGVYDTGFFPNSACYKGYDRTDIQDEMTRRIENIKEPYERSTGKDLTQNNFEFWDTYATECYQGRLFYTRDVSDLFDLYVALMAKVLTPKELDGDPDYINSMLCVEDKTTAKDLRRQREIDKMEINYKVMSMILAGGEEYRKLLDLLIYMDIISTTELDKSMVQYMFTNWLNAKNVNVDNFKDMMGRFLNEGDKRGLDVIKINRIIRELMNANVIRVEADGLIYGGEVLGGDSVSAALMVVDSKDKVETKASLLKEYNALRTKYKKIEKSSQKQDADSGMLPQSPTEG